MNITNNFTARGAYDNGSIPGHGGVPLLNISPSVNVTMNILTVAILIITMVSLGCTMELSKIKAHILNPKGVAIALACQFCIMPLTAFSLARLLHMDPIKAVTVLICGCCPGGNLSNIFTLLIKGDMNLSIVMTTCSSVAALGLMPLLLHIFCQGFSGLENAVPYTGIITALVGTLVPCAVGISINYYRPNYSVIVKKLGFSLLVIFSIIFSVISGFVVKDVIWRILMVDALSAAALMPLIGFTLGYAMSAICKLTTQCSRTISMETGCQNIQLCTTILKVAFPPQVIGPMFLFPLLYITFQCAEALLLASGFRCYRALRTPGGDQEINGHTENQKPNSDGVIDLEK